MTYSLESNLQVTSCFVIQLIMLSVPLGLIILAAVVEGGSGSLSMVA